MWLYLIGFILALLVIVFSIFTLSSDSTIIFILNFIMLSIVLIAAGGFLTWVCVMIVNAIIFVITEE